MPVQLWACTLLSETFVGPRKFCACQKQQNFSFLRELNFADGKNLFGFFSIFTGENVFLRFCRIFVVGKFLDFRGI